MSRNNAALHLAVVGHTNTGKTSLLRTLTRNPEFGEVRDGPGTTRHVEGAQLLVDDIPLVQLYDTPGMEDGVALLDYIDQLIQPGQRPDGPERIQRFLDSPESGRRFEQEARVLNKLLTCDAGLYVVDVRDPVLSKHKDELAVLADCGHPLLPVLNFTSDPRARTAAWREALARLGLHAIVEFDTIAPALDGELQLYDKLALLMDTHKELLGVLKQDIVEQRALRRHDARHTIADMLIDIAALRMSSPPDPESLENTTQSLRQHVRQRENRCVQTLLKRYNFTRKDFPNHALPLEGERWGMDLFNPQALQDMGIHLGKGMAAGAMAGATLDAFTAGISLGTATLVGAAVGGLWQGADKWGKRLMGRIKGEQEISVDDAVLRLLAVRQLDLLQALDRRGHAAQAPITLGDAAGGETDDDAAPLTRWRKGKLPDELAEARRRTSWSSMSPDYAPGARREHAVRELAARLE